MPKRLEAVISSSPYDSAVRLDGEMVPHCQAVTLTARYGEMTQVVIETGVDPNDPPQLIRGVLLPEEEYDTAYWCMQPAEIADAYQRFVRWQEGNGASPEDAFIQVMQLLRINPERLHIYKKAQGGD